jgi:hypothetical protein
MYETTFSFLAIYLLYTYIILSQDFLGFDLFPTLHSFFKSPIQEWSMFIDFLLISLLFLTRVNQGSLYNETFEVILCIIYERLQETINKIASVYEDKKSLFDFYFSSSILYNIQNETYRNITHRIYCTAAEKTLFQYAQRNSTESITPTVNPINYYPEIQSVGLGEIKAKSSATVRYYGETGESNRV